MGEEEKKPEEKKVEDSNKDGEAEKTQEKKEEPKAEKPNEEKKEEKKTEESKDAKEADSKESKEPPPPEEIVLRVYMHCEGCARKIRRCLRGFEGVEDVQTDCKTHKVVVKGKKADPLKVLDRVQRKSHKQVELLSPIPKPPAEGANKVEDNKEKVKPEEKKEEVIILVLRVHMHCEACAQEIRKRIQKMPGVQAADPDLKSSQVTVKGVFDPPKVVEYVYKKTGKHAVIVKQEPEKKEEEEEKKKEGEEKEKGVEGGEKKEEKEEEKKEEKKEEDGEAKAAVAAGGEAVEEEETKVELKKNELLYNYPPPKYAMEYVYAPQIFSDENPNACSVM